MQGLYDNVYIKKINSVIPGINKKVPGVRVLTSKLEEIVINTLSHLPFKIPEGFLKMYTDVRERYFWKEDVNLVKECQDLLKKTIQDIDIEKVNSVRYGTLTRTFIEPATSTRIMGCLRFSKQVMPYDTPNACLGMTNAIISIANEIQLGQTEYGIVIGFEDSRRVVMDTLRDMQEYYMKNKDKKYFRENIPTLTLGSGAMTIVLGNDSGMCKIKGFLAMNDSASSDLCIGAYENGKLLMKTNAIELQEKGVALVRENVKQAMEFFKWKRTNMIITHQVGKAHQREVIKNLSSITDNCTYVKFPEYGNMGSLSMPFTLAKAYEEKIINRGDKVLGIGFGSGLVTCVLGLEF